ncbi:aminopeptidase N [Couchioplanes caeruleus]|uniref:aminopeptidase N n=1 Tax=Couchioplanes caeruleus TaxID=56438 RepID=UPI00201C3B7D|nr:aminopeptidase N [Couchioplanes caeruleus]UQU61555.1 aminopeptidase N [Couchioplanes caeruleus]
MQTERQEATLSVAEARSRAALLTVHRYDVDLDLTGLLDGPVLRSRSTVSFTARPGEATFIDVIADTADAWLDGVALAPGAFDGERLHLPPLDGEHRLEVAATMTRTGQRAGIHRTADSGDGEGDVYVWTSFEPDDARRVFACFDQPDLKAVFAFTVHAPHAWTVVSNSAAASCAGAGTARTWVFEDTPRLSPYLTAVCAGPFHELRRSVDGYDLRLLSRRSLASHLDEQAGELFDLTARGLRFFNDRFASPFPQRTYTQVFCPGFPGAAMENWGCVAWNDRYLHRTVPTVADRYDRAVVLLHEMAHQWFGDLVTLRWWDDLWLNESFADWAALWAAEHATPYTGAWRWFLGSRKEDGYTEDAGPGTHPIHQDVATAADAKAAFDMITYGKGAGLLRQLAEHVGEAAFVAGLARYFADHAYGNATLTDLLAAVGGAAGRDLSGWAAGWLRTAGTDVLTVAHDTGPDGRYREVAVATTPPPDRPARRVHRLTAGVYDLRDDRPVRRHRIPVATTAATHTIAELAGQPAAGLILINDGDLTFARVRPDDASLTFLLRHGRHLPDPDSRASVRIILWHLLEDGLLAPADLIEYAAGALPSETDPIVRDDLLRTSVAVAVDWAGPAAPAREHLGAACLALAERHADAAARTAALQAAIALATTPDRLAELDRHAGDSIDLRWRWLTRLAAVGRPDPAAVERHLSRDPDPDAIYSALTVRAASPEPAAKEELWQAVFRERRVPPSALRTIGRAFWDPAHADVLRPYPDRFLAEVESLGASHLSVTLAVVRHLFPRYGVDAGFPARASAAAARPGMPPMAAKNLQARTAVLARMLRARALT